MNRKELEALGKDLAKGIKTQKDLAEFSQILSKITVEAALNAELDDHLGYEKGHSKISSNSRNGYTSKTIKTEDGQFELDTPRDRDGDFEPQLIKPADISALYISLKVSTISRVLNPLPYR